MALNPAFKSGAGDIYNQALAHTTGLYNQVQAGYNALAAQQRADQSKVTQGYNRLMGSVMGKLEGADAAERQRVADQYTALSGQQAQQMTDRGLGNTTVANAVQRGVSLDQAKAGVEVGSRFAQLRAQHESQIGLQGLGWQGQAIGQNLALGTSQLGTAAGFAPTFASLYGKIGDAQQRDWELYTQRGLQGQALQAGAQGRAGALTAQYAQQANQRGMAQDQLAYRYAALGQEGQQFGAGLDFRQQALQQQMMQQQAQMNMAYDLRGGSYGVGAPGGYTNPVGGSMPNVTYTPTGGGNVNAMNQRN